ncbi:MAG TPA: hypothetical protein VED46_06830 [Alphaproteobacteria bacterium]|nr:hypothetical protein [Alphaproteobacteria bacterium]
MSPAKESSAGKIVAPSELNKLQEDRDMAAAREALEKKKRIEQEQRELHDAFMSREIGREAIERFNTAVRKAAEQGRQEIMIGQFPASWCSDGGRRINNAEEDWPESLQGIARKVYDYHVEHLAPLGYKMRVEVLNYPGGMPGDIGIFFRW